jgi:hypothetical protein
MTENTLLIVRNGVVRFVPQVMTMKMNALVLAGNIQEVTNAQQQAEAVVAMKGCKEYLDQVEKARKEAKKPVIDCGRKIDEIAEEASKEIRGENARIAIQIAEFQAVELKKQRAAEALANAEISRLERERAEQVLKAKTIEEVDRAHAEHCQKVEALPRVMVAPKVEGQIVKEEWEFTVTDPFTLAKFHPNLVRIEPKRQDIKDALKAGLVVHGIEAKKVVVASVRTAGQKEIAA